MRVPYKEIALYALVKWNGKSEEEAMEMISTLPVDELENSVYAKGSVNQARDSSALKLGLSEEDKKAFSDACYNGPEDAPIFAKVGSLINEQKDKEGFVLGVIGSIIPIMIVVYGYTALYNKFDGKLLGNFMILEKANPFVFKISGVLILIGMVVGMLGSWSAVRKHLKI